MRAAVLAMVLGHSMLWAQSRVAGRVVHVVEGDTAALPGIAVVLHRVGPRAQGPLDTVMTDRGGRFVVRYAADTSAAFLVSSRYGGIEYFSGALPALGVGSGTPIVLVVADTSSSAPVSLRQRTLLISLADATGTRTVLDWFVIANAGELTRIAPDTLHPSWGAPLPPDGQDVELADSRLSQFAGDALGWRGDSVLVFAPISPGEKELMLQYRIPGSLENFLVPTGGVTDSVFVLLEGGKGKVATAGFTPADSQSIDGRVFRRWSGTLGGIAELRIALVAPLLTSRQTLPLLVALAGLGFTGLALVLMRRRTDVTRPATRRAPAALADAAARLDARYLGRESATSPADWAGYLEERARLKAELERALAPGPPRS